MLEPYVQETFLRAAQQIEMTAQDQRAPHVLMRPRIFPDGNAWCALLGDDLQSGVAGFGDTPAAAAADFDLQWSTAKAPPALGVLAVAAWAHEDDPARVISAAQKAQAERDGGASASSLRPYSVALVRAASGVAPVEALSIDAWVQEAERRIAIHIHALLSKHTSSATREATWQEVLSHLRTHGVLAAPAPNPCKLTECQGKPRCDKCVAMGLNVPDGVKAFPAPLSDERILHLWDTHVGYETGASAKQSPLGNKDKLAFVRAVLAASGEPMDDRAQRCEAMCTRYGNAEQCPDCPRLEAAAGVRVEGGTSRDD